MARVRAKRPECPNCGLALAPDANFCAHCGQENHTHKLPLRHFVVEWLSGMFNFDTKLLHTLRDLFWPPGSVIKEFNSNKRNRYVHPLRLYLFTSLLFFILLAWATSRLEDDAGPVVVVNADNEQVQPDGLSLQFEGGQSISDSTLVVLSAIPRLTNAILDSTMMANGVEPGTVNRAVMRLALNLNGNSLRKGVFVKELLSSFSKLMFVLLPVFAMLLKILFWRGRHYFTEHLVFALYFHTVLYLFFGLSLVLGEVRYIGGWADTILLPMTVGYLFWALRTVYHGSWVRTFWKSLALILSYTLCLILGLVSAAILSSIST